jgi:long-chain acyl-CoA synthetase
MYPGAHEPTRSAVIRAEDGAVLTYGELDAQSIRLARVLHDHGLRKGQHFAFLSENALELFGMVWAAMRSGLYVTAVNHHLSTDEIAYIINDCGAEALIVSAGQAEHARALLTTTPGVRLRLSFGGAVEGYASYEEALAAQPPEPLADQPRGSDMLYSSGTTGRPKGIKAPLPDRQVNEPGDPYVPIFAAIYSFDESTVYYSPAPLYHAAPLRFAGFIHSLGGTVVMAQQFDAEAALAAIERYRVTHSQWVPTMFVRMLKLPDEVRARYDLSSMRVAIHAAAPCPVDVKHAMMAWWGPIIHEYYSSTEGGGITFINPKQWLERPGSVGPAGLGIIRICGDSGEELPVGSVGTVYFERDVVAFQYHNDPEKTAAAQHPDHENWSTAGDVGYVDADGFLYLTDRKAFTIISGGVNIYPQEIEDCLTLHPKVLDVAVIGLPDAEMGEQVCAVVQVPPGVSPGRDLAEELTAFVRERIAHYKAPRRIEFTDSLPRTPTGKLVKRVLVDRYR